jgi:hypothetical protein
LGKLDGDEFEVECKAKTVDAGRRIARGNFYQFADNLLRPPGFSLPDEPCTLTITVDGRFPSDNHTQQTLIRSAVPLFKGGGKANLADGTCVAVKMISSGEAARLLSPPDDYEHRIILAPRDDEPPRLAIRSRSLKPDRMMAAMEHDLRDALSQLTGHRLGIITCYMPEVSSFEGTDQVGTATWHMIQRMFSHPKASRLVSITLLSDPQLIVHDNGDVETPTPCARFVADCFKSSRLGAL